MYHKQFLIQQKYLSGYEHPKDLIDFIVKESEMDLSIYENQEWLFNHVLQYKATQQYPLSTEYTKFFVKELIHYLENLQKNSEEMDILDSFYELLVQLQKSSSHEWFHRIFTQPNDSNNEIVLKVFPEFKQVGLAMWPSGFFIVEYMLQNKQQFQNRRMLELGSGIGFTAIVCHKFIFQTNHSSQTESIFVTDYLDSVLSNIYENMKMNHIPCILHSDQHYQHFQESDVIISNNDDAHKKIQIEKLDWTNCSLEQIQSIQPNLILAADVIYDTSVISNLVHVIDLCFTFDSKMECLFAITKRNESTFALFESECKKRGISSEIVPFCNSSPHFYVKFRDSTIITLRRFFKQK